MFERLKYVLGSAPPSVEVWVDESGRKAQGVKFEERRDFVPLDYANRFQLASPASCTSGLRYPKVQHLSNREAFQHFLDHDATA